MWFYVDFRVVCFIYWMGVVMSYEYDVCRFGLEVFVVVLWDVVNVRDVILFWL